MRPPQHRFVAWSLLFLAALSVRAEQAASNAFEPAFDLGQVDLAKTRKIWEGRAEEIKPDALRKLLGLGARGFVGWELGTSGEKERPFQLLLVLKEPIAVGAVFCATADEVWEPRGEVRYLREGQTLPAELTREEAWAKVAFEPSRYPGRYAALPPGTRTQAFLYTEARDRFQSRLTAWHFFKRRLHNMTPSALGIAPVHPYSSTPDALVKGDRWQNFWQEEKRKLPAPVSSVDPVWHILAWEQPTELCGVWLAANAKDFVLYAFRGPAEMDLNSAPPREWERLETKVGWENVESSQTQLRATRRLEFAPVKTRALKLVMTACGSNGQNPIAQIDAFAALTDLKDAPPPSRVAQDAPPPFPLKYTLPADGEVSMAIVTPDGRLVRNLLAQLPRKAGPNEEGWDLKDESGRYVAPGAYQLKGICAPPIELHYQFTAYPDLEQRAPDRTVWLQGESGAHGWLADHATHGCGAALGDKVYFGAYCAEGGVAFIECDRDGKKLWGRHDFGPWTGPRFLAADQTHVFIEANNTVWRMAPATHEIKEVFRYGGPERRGDLRAMTARDGKVYLAVGGDVPFFGPATDAQVVDLDRCLPAIPAVVKSNDRVPPNPRADFLRLLRLQGTPPGQVEPWPANRPYSFFPVFLESTHGAGGNQYLVLPFRQAVPLGSVVFPYPEDGLKVELSVLKDGAPYPPRANAEGDWVALPGTGRPGFECLAAPAGTRTRALRIKFSKAGAQADDLDDIARMEEIAESKNEAQMLKSGWRGRLEGLRMLRRRFENLWSTAKVRVNSGTVSPTGVWDAKRSEVISREKPGVLVMEWEKAQKVCGVALKEIDGAVTEMDVWDGADAGPVPLEGEAHDEKSDKKGWRQVARYEQPRRSYYQPAFERNEHARYMDGMVDFHREFETRAVRLRVVEQWLDNGPDYPFGLRYDLGASSLDTRRCRIYGVAPLRYLGGEEKLEPLVYQRLEVRDGETGKLAKEWPINLGWGGLDFNAKGELFAISGDHREIFKIDPETGTTATAVAGCEPSRMTVGPDGTFYVFPWTADGTAPLKVYDAQGKPVREMGAAGGMKPGPWDPKRFGSVHRMFVDGGGSLWIVETQDQPRRIVQYKTDGTFVKEMLGNTHYGGAGVLDRYNKNRAWLGRVEFELDWEKHTSKIKHLLNGADGDFIPLRVRDRLYLVSTPLSHTNRQSHAEVYLYDEAAGTVRLVAAFGRAYHFQPLRAPALIASLQGATPRDQKFLWVDRNGNGLVDPEEVRFERMKEREECWLGRFDEDLGCAGLNVHYAVKEFLVDGTPVYEATPLKTAAHLRLRDGSYAALAVEVEPGGRSENCVFSAAGEKRWSYPASSGVSGLYIPPWQPGVVTNEFAIIGHEVATEGELGEFWVQHANTGQWKIWTADGLLAGQLMYHKNDSRAKGDWGPEAKYDVRLDPLTAGQEHFHGFFTKTEADGKYYAIAGHNYVGLIEVKGLERFRRVTQELRVTPEDVQRVMAWDAAQTRKQIVSHALVLTARRASPPPKIDGKIQSGEWPGKPALLAGDLRTSFSAAFDESQLYLCWTASRLGPFQNSGVDFHRYFKTGAGVDFLLSTDPTADPKRTRPVKGDLRLLLTCAGGKPQAVLYQAVAPGARPEEGWKTFTQAAGETAFERVVLLPDVKIAFGPEGEGTVVEAAVPLKALGLQVRDGLALKMDWGILSTGDGNSVRERQYWANRTATGTSDESFESRLEPHLWGQVVFRDTKETIRSTGIEKTTGSKLDGDLDRDVKELLGE
jgi:hypothetical protein